MKSKLIPAALVATAVVAFPAGASADIQTAVDAAGSHTTKADKALDRAASLFAGGRDVEAARALKVSRREMAAASAAAKRADRGAASRSERGQAALAIQRVAAQQDENIEELIGLLEKADGRVENEIARAALADTRGRDKAVAVLSRLSERGVSNKSGKGIARALQALSQNRDEEIEAETEALASGAVSDQSKSTVGEAVEQNVEGQATAGIKLAELIASDRTPGAAKAGLQRAYDAVTGEQENSAQALERACERMPEAICTFVRGVVNGARANAQEMRNNHPSGPPSGIPSGQPAGTPSGQPSGTSSGQPSGTPSGQPSGTSSGETSGAPSGQPWGTPVL